MFFIWVHGPPALRLYSRPRFAQYLYTGVSSDLPGRIYQHREGLGAGFTKRYGIKRLVWFEVHETMESAILREKRIKRWPRDWKYDLIHSINPTWRDLAEDLGLPPLPLK